MNPESSTSKVDEEYSPDEHYDVDECLTDPTDCTVELDALPSTCTSEQTREPEIFLHDSLLRTKSTQTTFKPFKPVSRSVRTQTLVDATSTFFQTWKPVTRSIKTQTLGDATSTFFRTDSEARPVNEVVDNMAYQGKSLNIEQIQTNYTATTATEEDVESIHSSNSEDSGKSDSNFVETEQAEGASTDSEESCDESDERTILREGKPPQDQIKLIVFEEAILHVLGKCRQCGSKCIVTMEHQIGSSCKICSSCTVENSHYFEWRTGPMVNRMPIFHLLLASGILATGMESAKVLRLFNSLKIPNVKRRELSNILKNYGIPAVYEVWQKEQSARLKEIEGKPVVIASDMRVDSPGHSGLLGSGSTLDMGRNIILDTQIIKVMHIENNNYSMNVNLCLRN